MFDALPGSILVCPKSKPDEVKTSKMTSQSSMAETKTQTLKPLYMNKKMVKFFQMATLQDERSKSSTHMTRHKVMTGKIFVNRSQFEVASSPSVDRDKLRRSFHDIVRESEWDAVSERSSFLLDQS